MTRNEWPDGWQVEELKEIAADVKSGFACSKKNAVEEGIAHLRTHNIGLHGELNMSKVVYLPPELVDLEKYGLRGGDILFNNTNSVELVGKSAIIRQNMKAGFSNHLTRIRVDTEIVEPEWVLSYLRHLWNRRVFENGAHRWIGQAGYNPTTLLKNEFPLPSLLIQRRIISRIEELKSRMDEARKLRARAKADLEDMMSAAISRVFPDPDEELPVGWALNRVAEVSEKPQYGYTQSATELPVGPKFLRISDIQHRKVNWETVPYCRCDEMTMEKYRLQAGDIVVARSGATTGKAFVVRECPEAVFASYLIRIRVYPHIAPEYVFWFFQSDYYWAQVRTRGAAQPNMNARLLSKIGVPIPGSYSQQSQIASYLESIQLKFSALRQLQNQTELELEVLAAAILKRAFEGKLISEGTNWNTEDTHPHRDEDEMRKIPHKTIHNLRDATQ